MDRTTAIVEMARRDDVFSEFLLSVFVSMASYAHLTSGEKVTDDQLENRILDMARRASRWYGYGWTDDYVLKWFREYQALSGAERDELAGKNS